MTPNLPISPRRADGLDHNEAKMHGRTPMILIAVALATCSDEQAKANAWRALAAVNKRLPVNARLSAEDLRLYAE
jgi:hypothetical protein